MIHALSPNALSDHALIERFRDRGDQQALRLLLDRYRSLTRTMLVRFDLPFTEADFHQELYLILFNALRKPQKIRNLPAWLKTLIHHRLCDLYRRQGSATAYVQHCQHRQPRSYEVDIPKSMDRRHLAQEAFSVLNANERECLYLRYYGGMSYQEIADQLGLTFKQVCGRINRGLAKMRQHLHRYSELAAN